MSEVGAPATLVARATGESRPGDGASEHGASTLDALRGLPPDVAKRVQAGLARLDAVHLTRPVRERLAWMLAQAFSTADGQENFKDWMRPSARSLREQTVRDAVIDEIVAETGVAPDSVSGRRLAHLLDRASARVDVDRLQARYLGPSTQAVQRRNDLRKVALADAATPSAIPSSMQHRMPASALTPPAPPTIAARPSAPVLKDYPPAPPTAFTDMLRSRVDTATQQARLQELSARDAAQGAARVANGVHPTVTLNAGVQAKYTDLVHGARTLSVGGSGTGNVAADLAVNFPLLNPKNQAQAALAGANVHDAKAATTTARIAYSQLVLKQSASYVIASQQLVYAARLKAELQSIQRSLNAQQATTDVSLPLQTVAIALTKVEQTIAQAQGNRETALGDLEVLTGKSRADLEPLAGTVHPAGTLAGLSQPVQKLLDDARAALKDSNLPQRVVQYSRSDAISAAVKKADANLRLVRAETKPQVDLRADASAIGGDTNNITKGTDTSTLGYSASIGLYGTLALGSPGHGDRVAAAKLQSEAAQLAFTKATEDARRDVNAAGASLEYGLQQYASGQTTLDAIAAVVSNVKARAASPGSTDFTVLASAADALNTAFNAQFTGLTSATTAAGAILTSVGDPSYVSRLQ